MTLPPDLAGDRAPALADSGRVEDSTVRSARVPARAFEPAGGIGCAGFRGSGAVGPRGSEHHLGHLLARDRRRAAPRGREGGRDLGLFWTTNRTGK